MTKRKSHSALARYKVKSVKDGVADLEKELPTIKMNTQRMPTATGGKMKTQSKAVVKHPSTAGKQSHEKGLSQKDSAGHVKHPKNIHKKYRR